MTVGPRPHAARVTLIVVNYNGAHLLPACLDAVAAQDLPTADVETVVVDNASGDESLELLRRDYPWAQVIASPTNTGFAGGNNLALRQASTPYVVLLNNDAIPEPSWLSTLLAAFDEPGGDTLGAVTGKVVFLPRFVRLHWETRGFRPGTGDTRELGARVFAVEVDGTDVTESVPWERVAYGPEGVSSQRFRWLRSEGELLVPVPGATTGSLDRDVTISIRLATEVSKAVSVRPIGPGAATDEDSTVKAEIGPDGGVVRIVVPAGAPLVDVINNVGGVVRADGTGGDRGYQEVDTGQYDKPEDVFSACGNGMAMRTVVGRAAGWFDDDFFMYYEDTDLSWRLRSLGWRIGYVPSAMQRHVHSATSQEWSPRWVFHVERNRLLMLTKNANARLAAGQVAAYATGTLRGLAGAIRQALRMHRPSLGTLLVRCRVMMSYGRLLPRMLRRRSRTRRESVVDRQELESWMVS